MTVKKTALCSLLFALAAWYSVAPCAAQESAAQEEETGAAVESAEEGAAGKERRTRLLGFTLGASLLYFQEDAGLESDPPPILPAPSLALALMPVDLGFMAAGVELTADVYMTHYRWSSVLNRPVPAAIENRSALVIGPVIAGQLQVSVTPWRRFALRLYGGLAADLRVVMVALDLNEEDLTGTGGVSNAVTETEQINEYFWGENRFLYPVAGAGCDIELNAKWNLGLDFRVWFPVFLQQADESLPASEGWRFGGTARFTLK
jgi:hypothetical protein